MKLFENFYTFLREYCKNCSLNYDKIIKSPKSGNKDRLLILKVDYERAKLKGLADDRPAEVLLTILRDADGNFTVIEGENEKNIFMMIKDNMILPSLFK